MSNRHIVLILQTAHAHGAVITWEQPPKALTKQQKFVADFLISIGAVGIHVETCPHDPETKYNKAYEF